MVPHIAHDRKEKPLFHLAKEINKGFEDIGANYVQVGSLLLVARERVKSETKLNWSEWCKNYIRKKDGTPYSQKTIENYIYLAMNPQRVEKQKRMQRNNMRRLRKRARALQDSESIATLFSKSMTVTDQLNILMSAWENATDDAKDQFLDMIGARLK